MKTRRIATPAARGLHRMFMVCRWAGAMNNLAADHGSWLGQGGSQGPTFFALTAWFRVHLMDDVANRDFFYTPSCKLCTDERLTVQRNSLMTP